MKLLNELLYVCVVFIKPKLVRSCAALSHWMQPWFVLCRPVAIFSAVTQVDGQCINRRVRLSDTHRSLCHLAWCTAIKSNKQITGFFTRDSVRPITAASFTISRFICQPLTSIFSRLIFPTLTVCLCQSQTSIALLLLLLLFCLLFFIIFFYRHNC